MGQDTVLIGAFAFCHRRCDLAYFNAASGLLSTRTGKAPANLRPSRVGCSNCDLRDPLAFTEL